MPSPFISRVDLSNITGLDVTADPGATIAIDSACEMVRTLTEQELDQITETITLDGPGTDAIVLPQRPVNSIGTVNLIDSDGGTTTITDYSLSDEGVLIRKSGTACGWPEGRQNVEVTYSHGYGTIPEDLRMVALTAAARMIIQGVASSETQGDQQIAYAYASTEFTPGEKAIVAKYRDTPA